MRGVDPPKSGGTAINAVRLREGRNRWGFTEEREERGRRERWVGPMRNFFFFNKKPSHLRGECRHQFRVLGKFKRGVDVAHEDWLCVKEWTPLLRECPLHPNNCHPLLVKD
ncbi:hypothetical protein Hanom_Chr09g00864261 [Helianthus anomalus]